MSMEDFFSMSDMPEVSVLKTNAEVVSYMAQAVNSMSVPELQKGLFALLHQHSLVVLETSQRIMSKNKMHLKVVE